MNYKITVNGKVYEVAVMETTENRYKTVARAPIAYKPLPSAKAVLGSTTKRTHTATGSTN